jgi:uncharacterized membrane protein YphA (DoxX/SURF4 family)
MISLIVQWLFPCYLLPKQEKFCCHISCILHWLFRFFLACIFIYSGYIKVKSPLLFEAALYRYDLFPNLYVSTIARYFPWFEIALGLLLFIGFRWKIRYLAGASVVLLLFFIVILAITYFRGIEADCGCLSFEERISPKTIARDSLMLIPALYILFAGSLLRRRLKQRQRL